MALEYTNQLSNLGTRVIIAGLRGGPVTGVMKNELAIAGGNTFNTVADTARDIPVIGNILAAKDKIKSAAAISGRSAITQSETKLVWDGSNKPQFTIDLEFLSLKAGATITVLEIMKRIGSAALPTKVGGVFNAPLGYKVNNTSGRLILSIGKWFKAVDLVLISHNLVPSKEVLSDGTPLKLIGSITLEPFQAITYDDYVGYFQI